MDLKDRFMLLSAEIEDPEAKKDLYELSNIITNKPDIKEGFYDFINKLMEGINNLKLLEYIDEQKNFEVKEYYNLVPFFITYLITIGISIENAKKNYELNKDMTDTSSMLLTPKTSLTTFVNKRIPMTSDAVQISYTKNRAVI